MKPVFKFAHFVLVIALLLFLQSCSKESDPVKGAYQSGVLIVSEGAFGSANGDITYYNPSLDVIEQNVFKKVNGAFAGDVLQSISVNGDDGYMVLNGSSKIEIVDINTMKRKNTFANIKLNSPRFLKVVNENAYVSVWGPFSLNFALVDSYVLVVDTKTLTVVSTIDTPEGVERLIYDGKYLFAGRNGFSGSNTLTVIDPATNRTVKEINLTGEPVGMILDSNNKLWAITTGSASKLFRINPTTFEVEQTIGIGSFTQGDLAVTPDKSNLIYAVGNAVYKMSISATTAPTAPLFIASEVTALYGMNVDPKTGSIYISDAKNFSSAGIVFIFKSDGTFEKKVDAGIAPNAFIFR